MRQLGKVLIVDGSNLLHRQLSQPDLWDLSHNGKRTGAVFGFFRSLYVAMSRYPNHYPIVVFDKGRSARRLALYPNYKHTEDVKLENERGGVSAPRMGLTISTTEYLAELFRQGDVIKALLATMHVPMISIRGWEGDDLMAILSRITSDGVIVTDDKDMYQLLSPAVQIFRPIRTNADGTRGEVVTFDKAKHPVYNNARGYVVHKSIVGDQSDNIPKIANGIGEKRAEVLTDYIVSAKEDPTIYLPIMAAMKEPYFKKFIDSHEQYLINKQLIDLSLIEMDPMVLQDVSLQLSLTDGIPAFYDIIMALGTEGITKFDYNKMVSQLSQTRKEVEGGFSVNE